ncbi:MAG: hypothetical protein K2N27_05395 [Ruminococcus sp.]|nr:hypothetical protein [Ruminococcus sp.]
MMNKRTKLIVSLLFVIIIILAAAITRFYVITPEDVQIENNQTEIVSTVDTDSKGNIIFKNGKGVFGIADSGRIMAVPEWNDISFASNGFCIASKKIGGILLHGCIDYEGNIVLPFIYSNISKSTVGKSVIYCAENNFDHSYVLYNENFVPVLRQSWKDYSIQDNEITVSDEKGVYIFSLNSDELIFKNANVSGEIMDCPYNLNIYSRVLLSKLSYSMIEKMASGAEKYLGYAYTENDELISEIASGNHSSFIPAFKNSKEIISKNLLGISEIHVYSVSSDNGIPQYDISVNADTEIVYYDENETKKSLTDNYRLAVRFSGNSESDFHAISGKFELDSPVYPEPEPDEDITETE